MSQTIHAMPGIEFDDRPLDPEPLARLVIIESIHFQELTSQPHSTTRRFGRTVKTHERPYRCHPTIGEQWSKLDLGWLAGYAGPILVDIENIEGQYLMTQPTEEQRAEIDSRILLIGFESHDAVIVPAIKVRPGQSVRAFEPDSPPWVRATNGKVRINATTYPG